MTLFITIDLYYYIIFHVVCTLLTFYWDAYSAENPLNSTDFGAMTMCVCLAPIFAFSAICWAFHAKALQHRKGSLQTQNEILTNLLNRWLYNATDDCRNTYTGMVTDTEQALKETK